MIQFNLLPDVKLEYVKANRLKRVVSVVSVLLAGGALLIMVLLVLSVDVAQKSHMNSLNNQINTMTTHLKNIPNLSQVLTVQNEVNALPGLYNKEPVLTRLPNYLSELTPTSATISHLNINFSTNIISISGSTDSLATVNQFVDTIKLSSYQTTSSSSPKNAFSNVILSAFGYDTTAGASYTITATFDPVIFGNGNNVTLNVPTSNTSRNTSSQSTILFQVPSSSSSSGAGQ